MTDEMIISAEFKSVILESLNLYRKDIIGLRGISMSCSECKAQDMLTNKLSRIDRCIADIENEEMPEDVEISDDEIACNRYHTRQDDKLTEEVN